MRLFLLLPLFMLMILSACHRAGLECEHVSCTMEFRSIGVKLQTAAGLPYTPQKVQTLSDKGKLLNEQSSMGIDSAFTVVDDSDLMDLRLNVDRTVLFKIYLNNKVVKTQEFVVRADCCHVDKVSGPETITVN